MGSERFSVVCVKNAIPDRAPVCPHSVDVGIGNHFIYGNHLGRHREVQF